VVDPESMIDMTQSMACIQCGACVSSCLSMEADPGFIGPAALAKAYRFVGDPRDAETKARLHDSPRTRMGSMTAPTASAASTPARRGVAPMDQIMRLRRPCRGRLRDRRRQQRPLATSTPSRRSSRRRATLDESLLLQESFAEGIKGKLIPKPAAIKSLIGSVPTAIRGIRTGKMRSLRKLIPGVHEKLPDGAQEEVRQIYEHAEQHSVELNLYIKGEEGDEEAAIEEGLE
jgi:succinate dehydrogenase / fumarate reductase iron-sulfur subunit